MPIQVMGVAVVEIGDNGASKCAQKFDAPLVLPAGDLVPGSHDQFALFVGTPSFAMGRVGYCLSANQARPLIASTCNDFALRRGTGDHVSTSALNRAK